MAPCRSLVPLAVLLAATACSSGSGGHHASATSPSTTAAASQATTSTAAAPATELTATAVAWKLPRPVSREAAVVQDGAIVLAGGLTTGDKTIGDVMRIDPSTGTVTALPALSSPVHDCAGALFAGKAAVLGGGAATESDAVQLVSGETIGHLPTKRADLTTATEGTTTYVVGGYDGKVAIGDVLSTTDGTSFQTVTRLPVAIRYPAVAVTGHTLWVFGGELATGDTDVIQAVDLTARTASVVGKLATPVGHANAFVLRGSVWVVGGRAGGAPSPNIRRFDTATHTVTVAGKLPVAVRDSAVAVVGDTAYLLGGQAPDPIRDVVMLR